MGVHGLWRLLDSFGTVVQPDDLKGKRVAIDASIWIAQFRARIAPGEDVEHKILEGFLARILKLLFYGMKPVFVFDGRASSIKGAEHYRRMRLRALNAQALLKRRAKQILMAQVAAGALDLEELKKGVSTDAENETSFSAADAKNSAVVPASATDKMPEGVATSGAVATEVANSSRTVGEAKGATEDIAASLLPRPGKRRRCGPRRSSHHPRHHHHCRRRRLAPDAVSSRSTLHFLQDVEGILEERTRHEARVLHNALHNTSTSLFMGPRRAVEDVRESGVNPQESGRASPSAPVQPSPLHPCVVVVDDSAPQLLEREDVISVTDSDASYDDVDEEDVDDGSDTPSDCCAVSSSSGGVSVTEGGIVVQVEKRNASSRSPSSASSAAVLHSGDLAHFLTTLSQRTPPLHASPERERQRMAENGAGGSAMREGTAAEVPKSSAIWIGSSDADDDVNEDATHEAHGELEMSEDTEEKDEEQSDSGTWEEDDDGEAKESDMDSAAGAADLAWQPFTQRLDPALFLQHLTTLRGISQPSAVTPPRIDAADKTHEGSDDDDNDGFTPVKLGRTHHTRPPPPLLRQQQQQQQPTMVVVVNSSDGDEESNSTVHGFNPPLNGGSATGSSSVLGKGGDTARACGGGDGRSSPPPPASRTPTSKSNLASIADAEPTTAPRLNSTRSSVAIVPFELLHVVELLDCCGVPYVLSPAEADAQCAFLARNGLVDAVFTEDSDVLVHGATTVLRGFFSQSKNVVAYKQAELAACGVTKTILVALASLLGCDYTDGVAGIGLVGALEALVVSWTAAENHKDNYDSPLAVLHVLRRWRKLVQHPPQSWRDVDDEMTVAQFALFHSAIAQWQLLERKPSFPETQAVEAFYTAEVDTDLTSFMWLPPDWQQIRVFAGALGALSSTWLVQRYELARKEWLKREAEAEKSVAASDNAQRRLTDYGAQEHVRAGWAFQKQPRRHAAILSQLRAVQLMR
ncbi:putative DNA repair protein RAD2 [Leptomonas pyrrhocoris]|uniref:Putative DNA repair protein RAD2 n=1 Tax=Leptomonas pyrrhocoris TaxID=157538 RepID=A0A0M9GAX9_LEPPY|nr:putative DNA repair protein RAD2 [Leptomonas pyrrhocoris]KPA86419.1 putative DNA repair protein RAD2 [Leptomonas pyrrhocoris]|eukprot:XP_015664858.1 putative DNA repair protein RAD2 [Leptomonas pyrrhocoris]